MKKTNKITEGAMMVALVGLLLFVNRQFAGILEFAMYWLLSFPILIYTVKYGVKDALIPAVSMLLLSVMLAAPTTIFYLASSLLVGILYGGGVRKKWSNLVLITVTFLLTLLSYIITTYIFAAIFGYSLEEEVSAIQAIFQWFSLSFGGDVRTLALVISFTTVLLTAILQSFCIHIIGILLLKRLKIIYIPMKSVFDIKYPKWLMYICVSAILLFMINSYINSSEDVTMVITILYIIAMLITVSDGLMVAMCFLIVTGKRKLTFLLMLSLIIPFVVNVFMVIGVYDMHKDIKADLKRGISHG